MFRLAAAVATAVLVAGSGAGATEALPGSTIAGRSALVETVPTGPLTVRGRHQVPIHSSVRAGEGRTRIDLAATLSIHNASETEPLVIERLDYFDGNGRRVQRHVDAPVAIRPLATLEVFVAKTDVRGGTGSTFLIDWGARGPIAEPMIEAVMLGDFANQSYSFVSIGRRTTPAATVAP